jgi:hypothetical protein
MGMGLTVRSSGRPSAVVWTCAIALLAAPLSASAQSVALKSGESADLISVYWVENCRSILKDFAGLELLEGPPGVVLSLREQPVRARRQNCPDNVPGAVVIVTAKDVAEKASGTVRYRVRYNTDDGQKQSSHTFKIDLYPGQ